MKEQIQELLEQIEKANEEEQVEYGERDLEEWGGNGTPDIDGERLKKKIAELNQHLCEKTRQALKELEMDRLPRLEKYEEQSWVLNGHNSYSKTDPDATCMRMKEDRGADLACLQYPAGDRRAVHCWCHGSQPEQ